MDFEWRHLQAFLAVVETLNFSRAAERLHLSQPALSRTVRDLEERLGCRLFERGEGKVSLTQAGQALLPEARAVIDRLKALTQRMATFSQKGERALDLAHFGTLIAVYLGPFLSRLREQFPTLRFVLHEIDPVDALKGLRAGRIDAVITGRPSPELAHNLRMRTVYTIPPLIALPADHPLAKKRRLRLRQLANERWGLWPEARYPGTGGPMLEACRRAGFTPVIAEEVDSIATVFAGVAQGRFISFVGNLARNLPQVGIVLVPLEPGEVEMPIVLMWRPESSEGPVLEALADLLITAMPAATPVG